MQATATPEVSQAAPDFKLKGPGGQFLSLSSSVFSRLSSS